MRPSDIFDHHRNKPFQPIRICLSDGSSYDVRHPEMMAISATAVFIAQPPEVDGVPGRSVHCDPLHITRIEPLSDGQRTSRRRKEPTP